MVKKITAVLLLLSMLLASSACSKKDSSDRGGEEAVKGSEPNSTVVLWSDNTNVTFSMYTYFFNAYYRSFVNRYADYLDTLGLDISKPLKDQDFRDDRTWFEYIMILCFDEVKETVALADAAKDAGELLPDDALDLINSALAEYDAAAEKLNKSTDEYIASLFGENVNRATMEKCLRLQRLAAVYYESVSAMDEISTADCQKHFEENKNSYLHYDCMRIIVPEADSEMFTSCKNSAEFEEAMRAVITKNNFNGDYEKFADVIDSLVSGKTYLRCNYIEDSDTAKWAYDTDRKPYDVYTEPARDGDIAVTMILPTSEPGAYSDVHYRDYEPVRNIYYAVFESADDAKKAYDEWKKDGGEESFEELAEENGGGIAQNIDRGDYNGELRDWIFSDAVAQGDSTLITIDDTTTYLLYMLESGEPSWMVDAKSNLKSDSVNSAIDELLEKYPTEYSASIYNVEEVSLKSN